MWFRKIGDDVKIVIWVAVLTSEPASPGQVLLVNCIQSVTWPVNVRLLTCKDCSVCCYYWWFEMNWNTTSAHSKAMKQLDGLIWKLDVPHPVDSDPSQQTYTIFTEFLLEILENTWVLMLCFQGLKSTWILDEVLETALNCSCITFRIICYQTE